RHSRRNRPAQRKDQLQGARALGEESPALARRRQARGRGRHRRPAHARRTAPTCAPARRSDRPAHRRGDTARLAVTIRRGTSADVPRALEIWRDAVDATHGFLTPEDRAEIDAMVMDWLPTVDLWLALDDT